MTVTRIDAHRSDGRAAAGAAAPVERFGIDEVTPRRWRVVDRTRRAGDPFRVLALIDAADDAYRVMQFGRGFAWTVFASMDAAIANVVVTSTALARARLEEAEAWAPSFETEEPASRTPPARPRALPPAIGGDAD